MKPIGGHPGSPGDGIALNSMAHTTERWAEIDKIFEAGAPPTIAAVTASHTTVEPHERPMSKAIIDEWTRRR